jgi:predicted nucleic acid-binding protein
MSKTVYFIDTNIFLYAVGRDHPLKPASVNAIHLIRDGQITAVINTEIIQEILYHFQSIKQLPIGIRLGKDAVSIAARIFPVEEIDLSLALELLESYPKIQTRDAFHAATMIHNGIEEIISTDPHFDLIHEIKRIDPVKLG